MNSIIKWGMYLSTLIFCTESIAGTNTAQRVFSDKSTKTAPPKSSRTIGLSDSKLQRALPPNNQRVYSDFKSSFDSTTSSANFSTISSTTPLNTNTNTQTQKFSVKKLTSAKSRDFSFKPFYFGYFGDGMNGVADGNYILETSSRANVHFIREDPTNYSAWKAKLEQVKKSNNQAILMVQHVLYPWQSVIPYTDADIRFQKFYKELEGYSSLIAGYYLYDEPYHNNTMKGTEAKSQKEVYDGLDFAATSIKAVDSTGKIILTLAYPEIELNPQIPDSVDWFGVNCYYAFGLVCSEDKIKEQFSYIKKIKKSHQKLILTLDAYFNETENSTKQKEMIKRIKFWLSLTKDADVIAYIPFLYQTSRVGEQLIGVVDHPIVLGFLDKIYNNIKVSGSTASHSNNSEYALNLSSENSSTPPTLTRLPSSPAPASNTQPSPMASNSPTPTSNTQPSSTTPAPVSNIQPTPTSSVSKESASNPRPSPMTSSPNCNIQEPTCEGKDYVRRDSCGNEIERWKNAPAPYCSHSPTTTPPTSSSSACVVQEPTCEGKDYVRRDSCGNEIERWKNAPAPYCSHSRTTTPPTSSSSACVVQEPTCEGKDYVRRDSCGNEIERWKNAPTPYCN